MLGTGRRMSSKQRINWMLIKSLIFNRKSDYLCFWFYDQSVYVGRSKNKINLN